MLQHQRVFRFLREDPLGNVNTAPKHQFKQTNQPTGPKGWDGYSLIKSQL